MTVPLPPAAGPVLEAAEATCRVLMEGLARQSLYAAVAFAGAALATRFLRRAPARLQGGLWALVLLRLVLPPDLAAPWSARSVLASAGAGEPSPAAAIPGPRLGGGRAAAEPHGGPRPAPVPWAMALTACWIGGMALAARRLVRRRRRYRDLLRRSMVVKEPGALRRLQALRERLGLHRPVRLVVGDAPAPFTMGVLRPVVCLPRSFLAPRNRSAFESAVAHELAHVRGLDDLWLRLLAVLQVLFFFHPVCWWAAARHAGARELRADERLLASGALTPRAYGRGFVAAVRLGAGSTHPPAGLAAPALGETEGRLVVRIERILDPRTLAPGRGRLAPPALVAVALLVLPMAGVAGEPSASAPGAVAPAVEAPVAGLHHPVPGARLTSSFGHRHDPVRDRERHHDGIDLAAPAGTPVLAPADGVVRVATDRYAPAARYGSVVIVDHGGGLETFHAHLERVAVRPGRRVAAGDLLGTVGSTGEVTGPHLHFEVWRGRRAVDPARLLDLEP